MLVFHDPTERYVRKSPTDKWRLVPGHKSLLNRPPGKGLPIGNLTSQFFANVYLDALDQFAKHCLKARRYVRYVDDLVLVHESRDVLERWKKEIEIFLVRELRLALNERRTRLRPVSAGIDFLGYVVHPTHRLVRRRVVGNLRGALDRFGRRLARERRNGTRALASTADEHDRLVATLSSYLARFVDRATDAGLDVTVVRETRRRGARVKERRIAQRRGPFADCPPKPSAVVSRPGRRRDSVSNRSIDCRLSASAVTGRSPVPGYV